MDDIRILEGGDIGLGFVPPEYLGPGEDEYRIRDAQLSELLGREASSYRALTAAEREALEAGGNRCADWDLVRVSDPFEPALVRECEFAGLVRLGSIRDAAVEHHDLLIRVGITRSRIVACDIGDDCAVHDCAYVAHYIVGDRCLLLSNDEVHASNHAKFGNGVVMEGEGEELRVELDLMNEAGGRSVPPFRDLTCADAYLWARRRDDPELLAAFRAMTDSMYDRRRGRYGTIGRGSVLKYNRIVKDVAIGERAYVKGANKLKNLTILSSEAAPTQIGEGVELVNGIVGSGCRIFYGCKAVRFVIGSNSSLKYGARLIHSVLGDNSTVSCCEMLSNLVFPGHEQHHNTSFLIAALVRGQSNMAAGATIGSNHNSRAPDGEVEAGRGFWPGLCTSVKHSSRFASFCLLSKGDYRFELDLRLPFCLVDDDRSRDALILVPAYWWTHNLYALLRNEGKLLARDRREDKSQALEFSPFAPDSAEEMIEAIGLLESWTCASANSLAGASANSLAGASANSLAGASANSRAGVSANSLAGAGPLEIEAPRGLVEHSDRPVLVRKPLRAIAAYRQMLLWYGANATLAYLEAAPGRDSPAEALAGLDALSGGGGSGRERSWENLGGQLVPASKLEALLARARSGALRDWRGMHAEYARLSSEYPGDKAAHAWATLRWLEAGTGGAAPRDASAAPRDASAVLVDALGELISLCELVEEQVFLTKAKDHDNRFRRATFRSEGEFLAVMGRPEDNSFVRKTRKDMPAIRGRASRMRELLAGR